MPKASLEPVNIFFIADDGFAPYLAVTMQSLRENAKQNRPYRMAVITDGFTPENEALLRQAGCGDDLRFSLEFYQVDPEALGLTEVEFYGHFRWQTYYRLLAPELLVHWDKAFYIDADAVVCADVAELFDYNLGDNFLAATCDADSVGLYYGDFDPTWKPYADETFSFDICSYFQAGVLVWNLAAFRKELPAKELITYAVSHTLKLFDQDLLNIFCTGRVLYVPMKWNSMTDLGNFRIRRVISAAPEYLQEQFFRARRRPNVIHYAGPEKPWAVPDSDMAQYFWKYALTSPYAEKLLEAVGGKEALPYSHWSRERLVQAVLRVLPWQVTRWWRNR